MKFEDRRETTGDDGADFQRFVWEVLRTDYFASLLGSRYLRPYFSAGRDGGIDHLGIGGKDHIVVECKFFGNERTGEPRHDWAAIAPRLRSRLIENAELALDKVARPYKPWLDSAKPIQEYWFCTSGTLTPGAQVDLRNEIAVFFKSLAQTAKALRHLQGIEVQVLAWNDFSGALASNPTLRFRWFDPLPAGLASIGTLAHGRNFRGFLERLAYASRARFNEEMGPRPHQQIADESALLASLETGDIAGLVLHGPGGVGKTRLALELGRMAEAKGWLVLQVERKLRSAALESLIRMSANPLRLLLVIDYAEASNALSEVTDCVRQANEHGAHIIRFLATCRTSALSIVREVLDDTPSQEIQFSGVNDELYAGWVVRRILEGASVPGSDLITSICAGLPVLAAFAVYLHTEDPEAFDTQFSALHRGDDLAAWAEKRLLMALRACNLDPHATRRSLAGLAASLPLSEGEIAILRDADAEGARLLDLLLADRWIERDRGEIVAAHDIFADVLIGRYIFQALESVTLRAGDLFCDALTAGSLDRALISLNRLSAHPGISALDTVAAIRRAYVRDPTTVIALRGLLLWVRLPDEKSVIRLLEALPELAAAVASDMTCDGPVSYLAESSAASTDTELRSRTAAVLVPILDRAVARAVARLRSNNMILRRALLFAPERYRDQALSVIQGQPTAPQTHFLLAGWLRSGLERDPIAPAVALWLNRYPCTDGSSFVLVAWLKTVHSVEEVDSIGLHVSAWLAQCSLEPSASFIYRAWFESIARLGPNECASRLGLIEPQTEKWLTEHGDTEEASGVLAGWLTAAASLGAAEGVARIGTLKCHLIPWLSRHGCSRVAQFVYSAWLNALTTLRASGHALDDDAVEQQILSWFQTHGSREEAEYVLYAWLNAAAAVEKQRRAAQVKKVEPALQAWLSKFDRSETAQFVFTASLDAAAALEPTDCKINISLLEPHLLSWIFHHGALRAAEYVYRAWLCAAATLDEATREEKIALLQQSILRWISLYATLEDAQFLYRAWIDAGGAPSLISGAMLSWLDAHAGHNQSDFLVKSWLETRQDFNAIRNHALRWLSSNTANEEAVFVLKYIVRDPNLSIEAAKDVLAWCRAFPDNFDTICRIGPLLSRFRRGEFEVEVVEAATFVLERVRAENLADRGVRDATLGTLGQLLWKTRTIDGLEPKLDAFHAELLRQSTAYSPDKPMPPPFALNPMLAQHVVSMLERKVLDREADREALGQFLRWMSSWPSDRREKIRGAYDALEQALARISA